MDVVVGGVVDRAEVGGVRVVTLLEAAAVFTVDFDFIVDFVVFTPTEPFFTVVVVGGVVVAVVVVIPLASTACDFFCVFFSSCFCATTSSAETDVTEAAATTLFVFFVGVVFFVVVVAAVGVKFFTVLPEVPLMGTMLTAVVVVLSEVSSGATVPVLSEKTETQPKNSKNGAQSRAQRIFYSKCLGFSCFMGECSLGASGEFQFPKRISDSARKKRKQDVTRGNAGHRDPERIENFSIMITTMIKILFRNIVTVVF